MKPDVAQRPEKDCEISSTGGREQAGDVLNEEPSARSNKVVGDAGELEEEAGSLAGEACSSSGDGEVLAGEPSTEKIDGGLPVANVKLSSFAIPIPASRSRTLPSASADGVCAVPSRSASGCRHHVSHVLVAGDSGPVLGEDASAPLVLLALEDDPVSGALEAEVEASDP